MKSKRQYRDSAMFAFIGYIGIIIVVITVLLGIVVSPGVNKTLQENLQDNPTSGHDTLTPQDSLELKEPDAIYYDTVNDNMRDIDMDCGDNQIIPKYESFYDVPASTDSLIIVDDILYKRGIGKWRPVYPDEYVMWISSNGDTIWE